MWFIILCIFIPVGVSFLYSFSLLWWFFITTQSSQTSDLINFLCNKIINLIKLSLKKLIENAKHKKENELIAKREKLILEIEKESRRMEEFMEFAELDRMQQV